MTDFSVVRQPSSARSLEWISGFSVASQPSSARSLEWISDWLCQPTW